MTSAIGHDPASDEAVIGKTAGLTTLGTRYLKITTGLSAAQAGKPGPASPTSKQAMADSIQSAIRQSADTQSPL
jgi:hypothetical protein